MATARKLAAEIDRTLKKMNEGIELFDDIWDKVYSATAQSQKEKYEADLKKEIKKLQRFREQIKIWISSGDGKDKQQLLLDGRKSVERKMEQFKLCEREMKTKAYSKEGLAKQERIDPVEQAKINTREWIQDFIALLGEQMESFESDLERLSSGKGKRSNKQEILALNALDQRHKWHIQKLETVTRLLDNEALQYEEVDELKEDIEYYLEANSEPDFMETYGEDDVYEPLDLDTLAGTFTIASTVVDEKSLEPVDTLLDEDGLVGKSPSSSATHIIGRPLSNKASESKRSPQSKSMNGRKPSPSPTSGYNGDVKKGTPLPPTLDAENVYVKKRKEKSSILNHTTPTIAEVVSKSVTTPVRIQPPHVVTDMKPRSDRPSAPTTPMASQDKSYASSTTSTPTRTTPQNSPSPHSTTSSLGEEHINMLRILEGSLSSMPDAVDSDRTKRHVVRNPSPNATAFPTTPTTLFENPAIYEKFDLDTLFFIFYYQQGTYSQYLAAKELKKQSWAYHKKYMTWFKRHEEPKVTCEDFEQGTYVYFDYETGWCQRIKSEFTFEYSYLEDE